jgi:histidine ammonia-lyase
MRSRGGALCVALVAAIALLAVSAGAASAYNPIVPTQAGRTITLTGKDLTIEETVAIARHGAKVQLSPEARQRTTDAYEMLLEGARQGMPIYWFNRAPGSGRETVIFEGDPESAENRALLEERQLATFRRGPRSGAGPEVADEEIVRAQMAVRANTMTYEAASPQLTDRLLELLNRRITPVVQSRGSPGEGDLPQMSNIAGTMVGAGEAYLNGQRMPARTALAQAGLQPIQPFAADDAALTSTNAFSAGQAALLVHDAKAMLDWSDMTFAISMLGLNSSITPLTLPPQQIRPFPYQNWQAKRLLNLIRGSYLFDLEPDEAPDGTNQRRIIQDPLSFRDYNQRNGAAWEAWDQLRRSINIQNNSSDHNPVVAPGTKRSDSWELDTPWLRQYFVEKGEAGVSGFILSNSNFVALPWGNDLEAFTQALAQSIAGSVQRVLRFPDTFFTVVAASDVLSADVRENAPSQGSGYTIADLMAELQTLATPVPAQGLTLVRNVEDMEMYTRQKVARARMAVDTSMRLLAEELASGSYWMEVREAQNPGRSFGAAPVAALDSLRAVVPWQATDRPELPQGNLMYAFMQANPAAAYMGADAAPPTVETAKVRNNKSRSGKKIRRTPAKVVRANTRKSAKKMRARRQSLRRQAREPISTRPKVSGKK